MPRSVRRLLVHYSDVIGELTEAVPEIRSEIAALRAQFAPDPIGAYNVLDEVWSEFILGHLLRSSAPEALAGSWEFTETLAQSEDSECRALASELLSQLGSSNVLGLARPFLRPRTAGLLAELESEWSHVPLPWWRRLFARGAV